MAEFRQASLGGEVFFSNAHIVESANFTRVRIKGYVFFDRASIEGVATFLETRIEGGVYFISFVSSPDTVLRFQNCNISPAAVILEDCDPTCLDLTLQYDLSNIHFIDSPWEKSGQRIKGCTEDDPAKLQPTRDFYQRMKAKYKAENNEYEASKWHIAEKEAQRKLLRENGESRALRVALFLYRWSSQFGEDPVLAGKWVLGLICFVWLLLGLGGIGDGQRLIQGPAWPTSRESVADFGTVFMTLFKNVMLFKIVDFKPQYGWIDGMVLVLTRLVIPLQAALFAFALRNRFRR